MRNVVRVGAIASGILVAGCFSLPGNDRPPTSILIRGLPWTMQPGETLLVTAYASTVYHPTPTPDVTWSSSNSAVAKVAVGSPTNCCGSGLATITAVAEGTAEITVTSTDPPLQASGIIRVMGPETVEWSQAAASSEVVTTIHLGETVQWHNVDDTHSIVFEVASPAAAIAGETLPGAPTNSGPAPMGSTFGAQVFAGMGTLHYHCGIHPSMKGSVVVLQ